MWLAKYEQETEVTMEKRLQSDRHIGAKPRVLSS
jgi:hypothetical protein